MPGGGQTFGRLAQCIIRYRRFAGRNDEVKAGVSGALRVAGKKCTNSEFAPRRGGVSTAGVENRTFQAIAILPDTLPEKRRFSYILGNKNGHNCRKCHYTARKNQLMIFARFPERPPLLQKIMTEGARNGEPFLGGFTIMRTSAGESRSEQRAAGTGR